jgi:hypothetical protein
MDSNRTSGKNENRRKKICVFEIEVFIWYNLVEKVPEPQNHKKRRGKKQERKKESVET